MTKLELMEEIDELLQQGLNSAEPRHWEAALHDILALVRREKAVEGKRQALT